MAPRPWIMILALLTSLASLALAVQAAGLPWRSYPDPFLSILLYFLSYQGAFFLPLLASPVVLALLLRHSPAGRRVAGGLVLLASLALLLGVSHWAERAAYAALTLLALAGAWGWGGFLLRRIAPQEESLHPCERIVFSVGLGLGCFSLVTLLVGVCGAGGMLGALAIPAVAIVAGRREIGHSFQAARALAWPGEWAVNLALGCVLAGSVLLLGNARIPQLDYDVTEYHAQLPREYAEAGGVPVLAHNTFSGFPQAMEMHTLWGNWLVGTLDGVWISQLLHWAYLPLLLAGVALAVRRMGGTLAGGLFAGALVLAMPLTLYLSSKLYIEYGLGAFLVLTLLALRQDGLPLLRRALLAGILAGCAACCKYPGLLFVGLPAALTLLAARGFSWRQRATAAVVCGLTCWLVLSPWLIRNLAATGNPVFPLLTGIIPTEGWDAAMQERFDAAHRSTTFSWVDAIESVKRMFGQAGELNCAPFIFIPFLFWKRGGSRGWRIAAVWAVAGAALWFFLTHRIDRFFWPSMLVVAILSGVGWSVASRLGGARVALLASTVLAWATVLTTLTMWWMNGFSRLTPDTATVDVVLGRVEPLDILRATHPAGRLRDQIQSLPPTSRVLLVGAAEPFWLPSNVEYAVVFARHPLWDVLQSAATEDDALAALGARGITHIYVSWPELARLHATYLHAYDLPPPQQLVLQEMLLRRAVRLPTGFPEWHLRSVARDNAHIGRLATDYDAILGLGRVPGGLAAYPYELYELRP